MALDFSAAILEARWPKNKKQWSHVFNSPLNSAKQLTKHEKRMKVFWETPGLQNLHLIHLEETTECFFYQSKGVNQEKERHGVEERGENWR